MELVVSRVAVLRLVGLREARVKRGRLQLRADEKEIKVIASVLFKRATPLNHTPPRELTFSPIFARSRLSEYFISRFASHLQVLFARRFRHRRFLL